MTDIQQVPLHYGDNSKNAVTPPQPTEEITHIEGSEHHPARHGRNLKGQIDHALELDDKVQELKMDISKETSLGHKEKVSELDHEISEINKERDSLDVPV